MSRKAKARLCDPASWLPLAMEASSHNLSFAFFDMSVFDLASSIYDLDRQTDIRSLYRWSIIFRDSLPPCMWLLSFSSQFLSAFSLCMQTKTGLEMKVTIYREEGNL